MIEKADLQKWKRSQKRNRSHFESFHFALSIHYDDGLPRLSRKSLPEVETYIDSVARGPWDAGAWSGIDAFGGSPGGLWNRQWRVRFQAMAADSRLTWVPKLCSEPSWLKKERFVTLLNNLERKVDSWLRSQPWKCRGWGCFLPFLPCPLQVLALPASTFLSVCIATTPCHHLRISTVTMTSSVGFCLRSCCFWIYLVPSGPRGL